MFCTGWTNHQIVLITKHVENGDGIERDASKYFFYMNKAANGGNHGEIVMTKRDTKLQNTTFVNDIRSIALIEGKPRDFCWG